MLGEIFFLIFFSKRLIIIMNQSSIKLNNTMIQIFNELILRVLDSATTLKNVLRMFQPFYYLTLGIDILMHTMYSVHNSY